MEKSYIQNFRVGSRVWWAKQWHIEFFAFLFAFIRVFRGLKPSVAGLVTWGRVLTHRGDEQLNTLEAQENRSQE